MTISKAASMSEWAKVSLSEVATITPGFAFKSKEFLQHGTPVVKIKDINPPFVNSSDLARIDEDSYPLGKLDKYRLRSGDFVVAMTGATIGKVGRYVSKERGLLNQRVAKISPIHSVSWDFIYHAVSMPYFDRFIENNIDSESAQANISASGIGRYPIALPKLKEQEAVAEVLSSLDDKIDLLKRQNKTLEGMAEALFRQWFIEEAQDDWEEVELSGFALVRNGKNLPKHQRLECGKNPVYGSNGIIARTNESLSTKPVIVTGRVGTLGTVLLHLGGHAWFSDNSIWIEAQNLFSTYFFLMLADLKGMNCGSTQPLLRQGDLKALRFAIPEFNVLNKFEAVAEGLFARIHQNQLQVDRISVLRDTLLPKLMSGEVRVKMD